MATFILKKMFCVKEIEMKLLQLEKTKAVKDIFYLNLFELEIGKYMDTITSAIFNRKEFCLIEPVHNNSVYITILKRELLKLNVTIEDTNDEKSSIKVSDIQKLSHKSRIKENIQFGYTYNDDICKYTLTRIAIKPNQSEIEKSTSDEQSKKRKSPEDDSQQEVNISVPKN